MSGRGLVIRLKFLAEEMTLITDAVAIDFNSLLRGKLALVQPTQAIVRVALSEVGIDRAFGA